jgi:hypothetical protein
LIDRENQTLLKKIEQLSALERQNAEIKLQMAEFKKVTWRMLKQSVLLSSLSVVTAACFRNMRRLLPESSSRWQNFHSSFRIQTTPQTPTSIWRHYWLLLCQGMVYGSRRDQFPAPPSVVVWKASLGHCYLFGECLWMKFW